MPVSVDLPRRLLAEAMGTASLVATVVGSGVMAAGMGAPPALVLLANGVATAAMLAVLITMLGPVSGAHLNPAVSLALAMRGAQPRREAAAYIAAQVVGGVFGTVLAHAMFTQPLLQSGLAARSGAGLWLSEAVASFGLVGTILVTARLRPQQVAAMVALFILAAYWFTASTSFANPAVALARAMTGSFAGIRPADVPAFIAAQLAGAGLAAALFPWLIAPLTRPERPA